MLTTTTTQELEGLKLKLKAEIENLLHKIEEKKKQLESVSTTLGLLQDSQPSESFSSKLHDVVSANRLRGLTQLQALIAIAEANSGRLKLTVAKELLLRSGVTRSRKNANNIIFNVLKRSGRFKRIAPGEYELLAAVQSQNTDTLQLAPVQ